MNNYIDPPKKLLQHIDRIEQIKLGGHPPPVNVEVDLSNRCSLGCEWCHFAYTHTRGPLANKVDTPNGRTPGGDLMEYDLAISMIGQLYRYGVRSITWTGGGEPTLHPQFDEIVSSCPLPQGVYTNGAHISEHRAAVLKYAMQWVYISLDECTVEAYQKSKGVDRFHDVIDGVKRLVSANGQAVIGLGFMLHKDNYNNIDAMIALGKELGVNYVQFRPTIHYTHNQPGQNMGGYKWIRKIIKRLQVLAQDPFIHADPDRFGMLLEDSFKRPYEVCRWTQYQSVITPNGKVWTCVNKREYEGECLGDLSQEPFAEIWKRSGACQVGNNCRLMCRGHIPNITLNQIMTPPPHKDFI